MTINTEVMPPNYIDPAFAWPLILIVVSIAIFQMVRGYRSWKDPRDE